MNKLNRSAAVAMFLAFASGYFLSSLMRGVTATLAPTLTQDFGLSAGQLGLLGGGYFFGIAAMQLPLGNWLDKYGPRKVSIYLLGIAVLSCVAFALATGFVSLLVARTLGGIGVCACLMAALACFRRELGANMQQRANSWMLMSGSVGLLAATLPVQWALPLYGWRAVFLALGALFIVALLAIWWKVPAAPATGMDTGASLVERYRPIFADSYFRRLAPIGFVNYGSLVAIQTLWAGPWLSHVAGHSPLESATGLFWLNCTMLVVFWLWGMIHPRLAKLGLSEERLLVCGLPAGFLSLAVVASLGADASWPALVVFFALSSFLALTHAAVGMAFAVHEAGRALSAFNLLLFMGTFVFQWAIGIGIDALVDDGWSRTMAYQTAFGVVAACCMLSYIWFIAYGYVSASQRLDADLARLRG